MDLTPGSSGVPTPKVPKLRINRNPSKNGVYECAIIESTNEPQPSSVGALTYRTESGDIFTEGDVVWAKLVGWPWWPAKIETFQLDSEGRQSGQAMVKWINWNQISLLKCDKLQHFLSSYDSKLDRRRKANGYKEAVDKAAKEAWKIKRQRFHEKSNTTNKRSTSERIVVENSSSNELDLESRLRDLFKDYDRVKAQYDSCASRNSRNSSVAVAASSGATAEQNNDLCDPLVDIGRDLNFLTPRSLSTCIIPSFSDDDDLDQCPVCDPDIIRNVYA